MAASMKSTSFQKKTRTKTLQITGTKPSLYNNQLLISTGVPSLDNVLGGGIAVGTVLLVEEDVYGSYGRLLLKYFCAESVMTGHSLLLTSCQTEPQQIYTELPAPILDDPAPGKDTGELTREDVDDTMKIAWRYRHLPKFQSNKSAVKFGHYYDLTKCMDTELTDTIDKTLIGNADLQHCTMESNKDIKTMNPKYLRLLQHIKEKIESGNYATGIQQEKRNILRIAIHSLGSPLWDENGGLTKEDHYNPSLPIFLLALRAILRKSFAVCMITMPTHLFCDKAYVRRVEKLCDTVVDLDSFAGSDKEKNPAYKEYHGLFHIRQLPHLNSLTCHMPDTLDLAFKLRRKKFVIEKLHLPPELSETASRDQEDPVASLKGSTIGCAGASSGKSKLDF